MIQRFQIEDLVVQDSSGVVFRALDTETNQTVAVRRFFPFGANGGGLHEDEQTAYNIAVERLATISHPALRAVICGGCDPVDGMPYIATEWIEGPRLDSIIAGGPLDQAAAAHLLSQALEVCELLSEVLAEEAVWVETSLRAIVVGAGGTGRGVTFWIAPLKWLGKNDGLRGLESIIILTEEIMGWTGKSVFDQTGQGLGDWLQWLRGKARTTTLREVREMLAAAIGVASPVPAKNLVRQATRPLVVKKKTKKKSPSSALIIGTVALISIAAGGLALIQRRNSKLETRSGSMPAATAARETALTDGRPHPSEPAGSVRVMTVGEAATPPMLGETPVERATRRATELTAAANKATEESDAKASSRKAEIAGHGGVFTPADHELLVAQDGKQVTVEGTFAEIGYSKSRKTMYLQFSKKPPPSETRGSVVIKDGHEDLTESKLAPLVGRKIRIHGKVQVEKIISLNLSRPVIEIVNRNAIEVVE